MINKAIFERLTFVYKFIIKYVTDNYIQESA